MNEKENYVTSEQCEDYRNCFWKELNIQKIDNVLNTEFRKTCQRFSWLLLGAVVTGFVSVTVAILTRGI